MTKARVHQISISDGGVPKHAVESARITSTGIAGDRQHDTKHHGGPDRAVCLFSLEVIDLPYVEAARARGERSSYVMAVEIMPNIRGPLLVDFGLRLTTSILLVAALSFVGLGLQPPAGLAS